MGFSKRFFKHFFLTQQTQTPPPSFLSFFSSKTKIGFSLFTLWVLNAAAVPSLHLALLLQHRMFTLFFFVQNFLFGDFVLLPLFYLTIHSVDLFSHFINLVKFISILILIPFHHKLIKTHHFFISFSPPHKIILPKFLYLLLLFNHKFFLSLPLKTHFPPIYSIYI